MDSKNLKKYWTSLAESISINSDKINNYKKRKFIHAFRMATKKLRIFLWLTNEASQNIFDKKDHYKLLSKYFKLAGNVREN